MLPLPANWERTQPTFNNNAEYYRWLLNQLTTPLGLQTFSVKQLSEMAEDGSLTGSHGLAYSEPLGSGATCQFEAVMDSTQVKYVVGGSKGCNDGHFRQVIFASNNKVHLDFTGQYAGATQRGHFGHVFTTVVARFGNECTEWIREKYGANHKCIVTLKATVISRDQAKNLYENIETVKCIAQLAVVDENRPFSRSTATSFEQLGTSRPESMASNITLTGTEYSDDTGSSTSFERLSMQQ